MVLNMGLLDWEPSALTTRSLLYDPDYKVKLFLKFDVFKLFLKFDLIQDKMMSFL